MKVELSIVIDFLKGVEEVNMLRDKLAKRGRKPFASEDFQALSLGVIQINRFVKALRDGEIIIS